MHDGPASNPFVWQGQFGVMQEGETSLYYMRARYYDALPARFLTRDPLDSLAPNEIDPYQYARGSPLLFNDPTGLAVGTPAELTTFFETTRFAPSIRFYGENPGLWTGVGGVPPLRPFPDSFTPSDGCAWSRLFCRPLPGLTTNLPTDRSAMQPCGSWSLYCYPSRPPDNSGWCLDFSVAGKEVAPENQSPGPNSFASDVLMFSFTPASPLTTLKLGSPTLPILGLSISTSSPPNARSELLCGPAPSQQDRWGDYLDNWGLHEVFDTAHERCTPKFDWKTASINLKSGR